MSGGIRGQGASYRNGLVLGLTMAEILLLLLFCMLIALGAAMQTERQARKQVEERLAAAESVARKDEAAAKAGEALVEALKANPQVAETLGGVQPASPEFDKYWRRLVEGASALDALEGAGISRDRVLSDATRLAEADKAVRAAGGDPAQVAKDAVLGAKAREALAKEGLPTDGPKAAEALAAKAKAAEKVDAGHKWPPIISLSEADGFYFASGRADLDADFARKLAQVVIPKVVEVARQYGVDTLEVVGHTDEQPMGGRSSNLDRGLPSVLHGRADVAQMTPADNAGLGLARAVSVVSRLVADKRLSEFRILPLSGGPLIGTDQRLSDGTQAGDVRQRRRIEIRLRQSAPTESPKQNGGFLPSWIKLPSL